MRLTKSHLKELIRTSLQEDWWDNLSSAEQSAYTKKHPKSAKAQQAKKEKPRAATPATDKDNKRPTKNPFPKESPAHKTWKKKKKIEGKLNEKKETIFDVAERVMKDRQAQKYKSGRGQVMVDMQTANLLTKVWKKVNPKMKKILSDLGYNNPAGLIKTLWAVVK